MSNVADAIKAVTAAERRKLPVPDAVREAAAVQAAVADTARRPDPERPALPEDAASVQQVIRDHAAELQLLDVTRRAANRFHEEADHRYVQAVRAAIPAWIDGLQKEYAALVGVVQKAAARLPDALDRIDPRRMDWNNAAHTAAYTKAEGAAVQLEQLISDRADMVKVAGGDGGRDNALFAVAALPEPTVEQVLTGDWKRLSPAIAQWRELKQQPVARWVYLVRQQELSLSLATPGEVRQRAAQVERWRDAGHAMRSALSRSGAEAAVRQHLAETA